MGAEEGDGEVRAAAGVAAALAVAVEDSAVVSVAEEVSAAAAQEVAGNPTDIALLQQD